MPADLCRLPVPGRQFWRFDQICWGCMDREDGAGVWVPEQVWVEFEDLIGIVRFFSAAIDGPARTITMSSDSLLSMSSALERRLRYIGEHAQYVPGDTTGDEDNAAGKRD